MTQTELEIHLITTPERPKRQELTEDQILEEFGPLIWDALQAFATDPAYYAEMCEMAMTVEYKRAFHRANRNGTPYPDRPAHMLS